MFSALGYYVFTCISCKRIFQYSRAKVENKDFSYQREAQLVCFLMNFEISRRWKTYFLCKPWKVTTNKRRRFSYKISYRQKKLLKPFSSQKCTIARLHIILLQIKQHRLDDVYFYDRPQFFHFFPVLRSSPKIETLSFGLFAFYFL